jgi:hypothetical protein
MLNGFSINEKYKEEIALIIAIDEYIRHLHSIGLTRESKTEDILRMALVAIYWSKKDVNVRDIVHLLLFGQIENANLKTIKDKIVYDYWKDVFPKIRSHSFYINAIIPFLPYLILTSTAPVSLEDLNNRQVIDKMAKFLLMNNEFLSWFELVKTKVTPELYKILKSYRMNTIFPTI